MHRIIKGLSGLSGSNPVLSKQLAINTAIILFVSSTVNAFLEGYSQYSPDALKYLGSPNELNLLLETTELISLPLSIIKESKKDEPAEYYKWSQNRLLELTEK